MGLYNREYLYATCVKFDFHVLSCAQNGEHKRETKTNSILKKLEKCLSIGKKSTENNESRQKANRIAPTGCFSVYVGPEKQRFVIKTEFVNHPLFRMLLEDAELEYGFANTGPLHLPCEVDLFVKVLAQMECEDDENDDTRDFYGHYVYPCGFSPFNHTRRRLGKSGSVGGCGPYHLHTPPRFVKINHYG
ncbi:SAUR-like auxin-responsive protein family [Striga asiatica]|uniref:SAUR-like auxin-responsive protein family n=1 Tax=Striga asiatica TaxID=4170 RepID=A0A5A7QJK8_STRAF|nr:SAUR-like auxin-responsive protein family [Striga asiatica]